MIAARLLFLFAVELIASEVQSLCVETRHGNDGTACLRNDEICCESLKYAVENFPARRRVGGTVISILQNITLDSVVSIKDFTNLAIQSKKELVISCVLNSSNSAGLYFENVINLDIVNLTILNCGMLQNSSTLKEGEHVLVWCAVYVINSSNLSFNGVSISHSKGAGLILYDTIGHVAITNCLFDNNTVRLPNCSGGGGLRIEYTCNSSGQINSDCHSNNYIIEDCKFFGNRNGELEPESFGYVYYHDSIFEGNGRGGGLSIVMRGTSVGNAVDVTNCVFVNNTASTFGGGVYVSLRDNPSNNIVTFTNCIFEGNECMYYGGGGLRITLLSYEGVARENQLLFQNCNFTSNSAKLNGGGTSIVSTRQTKYHVTIASSNNVSFHDCMWQRNEAELGSAVDISPALWDILGIGLLPKPHFLRCTFRANRVSVTLQESDGMVSSKEGVGTVLVSNFVIHVEGYFNFFDNDATALYLQSAIVFVRPATSISFVRNKANNGGGVALNLFSVVYVSSNVSIEFVNNTANIVGGAVHAVLNERERTSSRSCFIQTRDRNLERKSNNITIFFAGNRAKTERGNSIFMSSLNPCAGVFSIDDDIVDGSKAFNIVGLNKRDITTSYHNIATPKKRPFHLNGLVPGKYFRIPMNVTDELLNPISVSFSATLGRNKSIASLNMPNYESNTRSLQVKSQEPNDNQIHLVNGYTTVSINVSIVECPPGHILDNDTCSCGTSHFKGIWKCKRHVALIVNGFWIGLCDENTNEQCTGHCPDGFCINNITVELKNVSVSQTHKLLCMTNREGRLCSKCSAGTSVYYHSPNFKCGEESLCKFGILFYLASEILPLTIIFVMVIMLNVSFTNGSVNGVILYAQIFDIFVNNFHNVTHFPNLANLLIDGYRFVYGVSNLNYFSIEQLSFCLWKGATTLDVIAWKYVTIVYALCLIWVTVFLLSTTLCKRLCVCWRPHTLKNAAIHGLVAFLTMCYSQCARICFFLLTRVSLRGANTTEYVVYMSGENKLFDKVHMRYGIPALFFMLVIVTLPPLLLLLYPLSFTVLAVCRLSELKILNRLSNLIPVQLFDAFQSCYKDNFRFFSGLYFFYRTIPLILYAINTDLILFYFSLEVFLIIALALNAILQPYKNRWHNTIDSLVFTNLALINMISLYNYNKINEGKLSVDSVKLSLTISTAFQVFLIYLPLMCVAVILFWKLGKWVKRKAIEWKISKLDYSRETLLDSTYLPPLRDRCSIRDSAVTEFVEMK